MQKRYLLAPGPTAIPPAVLLKMAEPMIHHRNPLFEEVVQDVRGAQGRLRDKERGPHLHLLWNGCHGGRDPERGSAEST